MKLAISEITTLPADLETDLAAFAGEGWNAIELSLEKAGKFLESRDMGDLKAALQRHGLTPVAAIGLAPNGPGLFLARGDGVAAYMQSLQRQIRMCEALGIPCLGIGADPARGVAGRDWVVGAIENVRAAATLAAAHGVTIGIEALSLSPPIGPFLLAGLDDTRAFVEAVDHPAVGINFDVFHFTRSGGTLADIRRLRRGQVIHVHVCDLPEMPPEQWEDRHRLMPGAGDLPLTAIRDALIAGGYDGYWALELLNEELWTEPPAKVARTGKAAMDDFASAK